MLSQPPQAQRTATVSDRSPNSPCSSAFRPAENDHCCKFSLSFLLRSNVRCPPWPSSLSHNSSTPGEHISCSALSLIFLHLPLKLSNLTSHHKEQCCLALGRIKFNIENRCRSDKRYEFNAKANRRPRFSNDYTKPFFATTRDLICFI